MAYYCPNCSARIDSNIFFQITGQCMCHQCGAIVDLTNVETKPVDRGDQDGEKDFLEDDL